jgi:hypothetical protein
MAEPKNNKPTSHQLEPLSGVRQKGETDAAIIACNDWLRMGAGRSLVDLTHQYSLLVTRNKHYKPPTTDYDNLKQWSSKFLWAERASEYDATWEQRKNAEREKVFANELVNDFGRIKKLVDLAQFLEAQLYEHGEPNADGYARFHNVWNPDVKQIGSGDEAERVDIERFNPAIISEFRATLADIAKEVGGRVEKKELTGKDGGALTIKVVYDDTLPSGDKND